MNKRKTMLCKEWPPRLTREKVAIGKQRGYELARASNGGTGKKNRGRLSDSNPPSQYSALNSVNGQRSNCAEIESLLRLPSSSSLFAFRPSEAQSECVKASPANCSLQRREGGREMGWLREVRVINLSLLPLSLLYLDQFVSAASRNCTDQTERGRESGVRSLARSLRAEWSRQQ